MLPSGSSNLLLAAGLVNAAIAIAKLIAAAITGSGAIRAEFIHSIALATSFALILTSVWRAGGAHAGRRSRGEMHFWCLVVPILIYSLGAGVTFNESMAGRQSPPQLADLPVGIMMLSVALVLQLALALVFRRHTSRSADGGGALFQVMTVTSVAAVASTSAALAGVAAAYAFGTVESDAVAAVAVGLILGGVVALMAVATRKVLANVDREPTQVPVALSNVEANTLQAEPPSSKRRKRKGR